MNNIILITLIITLLLLLLFSIYTHKEHYESGQQFNSGNFVATPYEWKQLEKKFKLDPVYNAIGGYSGQQRTTGFGSDWGWVWRGPMVWNGWKYY